MFKPVCVYWQYVKPTDLRCHISLFEPLCNLAESLLNIWQSGFQFYYSYIQGRLDDTRDRIVLSEIVEKLCIKMFLHSRSLRELEPYVFIFLVYVTKLDIGQITE